MSRSLFLLLIGLYSSLLGLAMVFVPEPLLNSYGVPTVDRHHVEIMQFLGIDTAIFGLMMLLNRTAPNSQALRTFLLGLALAFLVGVVLGLYHVYVLLNGASSFFVVDTLVRLAIGLGFLYFYNRETKLAQNERVMA
jgi:hypothetical protein